jgi:hypothetical protein
MPKSVLYNHQESLNYQSFKILSGQRLNWLHSFQTFCSWFTVRNTFYVMTMT